MQKLVTQVELIDGPATTVGFVDGNLAVFGLLLTMGDRIWQVSAVYSTETYSTDPKNPGTVVWVYKAKPVRN